MNRLQTNVTNIWQALVRFFSNPRNVFWFGMLIALTATALETFRQRNFNYFDYQDSTLMFWSGINPYTREYVDVHNIYFLYSPVFNFVYAPIFMLPWWLGPFVWNVLNYCLMYLAIWLLPEPLKEHRNKIFLFLLLVIEQTIFCFQQNIVLCYLWLFGFILLERNKPFWAVLLIMFGACTKVYPIAGLAMLLCYPHFWRNIGYAVLCGVATLALPGLNPHFPHFWTLYQDMFTMISGHHSDSDFIGILFARGLKWILLPNMRAVQIGTLAILATLFFWRRDRWNNFYFKCCAMAVLMGYIILFSDCPETHTYIISLSGYMLVFWLQPVRRWYDWVLFWSLFINFGILPVDVLFPAKAHEYIHWTYWLDVYSMFFAWLRVIWLATCPKFQQQ